jgi:hypothetical protein
VGPRSGLETEARQRFSNCGARMGEVFILNEIWVKGKVHFDRRFALFKYFIYSLVPVLAPNYKQHILSPIKVRKVCYSFTELYVKSVYLNLFGWRESRRL